MKIPFTGYEIKLSKRSVSVVSDGQFVSYVDWAKGKILTKNTPVLENVYKTMATEFGKVDLRHMIYTNEIYKSADDDLNYIVSERPNPLQTKYDFLYTVMYQYQKYGNSLSFLRRDRRGRVYQIDPLNVNDYEFGNGYDVGDGIYIKIRDRRTNEMQLVDYRNLVHIRLNPNDLFNGDQCSILDCCDTIVKIVDESLKSLLTELSDNGTVYGVITLGNASAGTLSNALVSNQGKTEKSKEVLKRIRETKGGILVLDAGEQWHSLSSPFRTVSADDIDRYMDYIYTLSAINKKIINGTASGEEMELFFSQKIVPVIEQFVSELNYKVFTQAQKKKGERIEYYHNPFEYLPIAKAIDVAYKGAMDITTNERRRMIYKLPPIEGGDVLMSNKNFEEAGKEGVEDEEK